MRAIPDSVVTQMRAMKSLGKTYPEIALAFGVSSSAVQRRLKEKPRLPGLTTCEHCGKVSGSNHEHHLDYARRESIYLCPSCHRKAHPEGRLDSLDENQRKEFARSGGLAISENRDHMAEIGRIGGQRPRAIRGFAAMTPEKRKQIASLGGQKVSKDKDHMSEIGAAGGKSRSLTTAQSIIH